MTSPAITAWAINAVASLASAVAAGQQIETAAASPSAQATTPADWKPLSCRFIGDVPFVLAKTHGKEGLFVVDTGAPTALIDSAWARQVGLSIEESYDLTKRLGGFIESPDLDVSGDHFVPARISCSSLQLLTEAFGTPIAGILGNDYLRGRVLRLDYVAQTIGLHPADGFGYTGKGVAVPLALDQTHYAMTLGLLSGEGKDSVGVMVLLDTGADAGVWISDDLARSAGVRIDAGDVSDDSVGVRGRASGTKRIGHVGLLTLGRLEVKPPEVEVGQVPAGAPAAIGGETLYNYFVILDCPRSRVILEPNPASDLRARTDLGLELDTTLTGDGIRIKRVKAGLLGDKSGLLAGDVFLKIEGKTVKELGYAKMRELRDNAVRDGKDLHMTFVRGEKVVEITVPTQ